MAIRQHGCYYCPESGEWLTPGEIQERAEQRLAEGRSRAREEVRDRVPVPWGRFSEVLEQLEALEKRVAELEQASFGDRLRRELDRRLKD